MSFGVSGVSVRFGSTTALDHITFAAPAGVALLAGAAATVLVDRM